MGVGVRMRTGSKKCSAEEDINIIISTAIIICWNKGRELERIEWKEEKERKAEEKTMMIIM